METGIFLFLCEDNSFHSIIFKRKIGEYTYLIALGYAGGGEFAEFYGKLKEVNDKGIVGAFSDSTGSGEWQKSLIGIEFNADDEWFDPKTEELYVFFSAEDVKIQIELLEEVSKYVYFGYDEETDTEYEYPEIKPIDLTSFTQLEEGNQYHNKYWDDYFLEITNSNIWNLSLRFPHISDMYL